MIETVREGPHSVSRWLMEHATPIDPAVYEWRPRSILLPRIALKATRRGTHIGLILPGHYMIRRSRSMGRLIYRNYSG